MDTAALSTKKQDFINDDNYRSSNQIIKILIDNLVKIFEEKCTKEFYPKWRGKEGNTKVFIFKLNEKLISKYGSRRENMITIRVRMSYLDIEVYKDINDLFNTNLMVMQLWGNEVV